MSVLYVQYKCVAVFGILLLFCFSGRAQSDTSFRAFHFGSMHTSFPDTGRAKGRVDGNNVFTPVSGHYDDSSVLLIIPPHLSADRTVDLVFWFHGWHNSIDTAVAFYGLARQLTASRRNAILVLPETGRDVGDSYGGKLQQKGMFKDLVADVMNNLKSKALVPRDANPGHIVLAGHSGAYQVIADILKNGEVPVDEVFLFDALYSRVNTFMDWINADKGHHFIHWFTNHGGGTDIMSDTMMIRLKGQHMNYQLIEEKDVTPDIIRKNLVLFVHSLREHNVIINDPDDFQLLLENSLYLRTGR